MKRILIGILTFFVILLAALIILPIVFKEGIVRLIKEEANKNLNARVEFGDFGMSLFGQFPDFSFSIEDISVVGIDDFRGDTLVTIEELNLTVDLMSVIHRKEILINAIRINGLNAMAKVLQNGKVNWDIAKKIETNEVEEKVAAADSSGGTPLAVSLDEFLIKNSNIVYSNAQTDILVEMLDLNFSLSGDFTEDFTTLETKTTVSSVTVEMDTVKYLNKTELEFHASLDADFANAKYTLKKNEFRLNQLFLEWEGFVAIPDDDVELSIRFKAKETEFKNILSLIPAVYSKDFEEIKTTGRLTLEGYANGTYSDQDLPSFVIRLFIEDATVQYPNLPRSAENIDVNLSITNPGGSIDKTIINITKFHVEVAENPIDIRLVVKTPVSDPEIYCQIKGELDLSKIGDVIPLEEGAGMSGLISSDISLRGKMSTLEKERYEEFHAVGDISIKSMRYKSTSYPQGIVIKEAKLQLSPQYADLKALELTIGQSDIRARGRIENFIPYAMTDNALLKGELELNSHFLNLNEFITDQEEDGKRAAEETTSASAVEIPGNIDFVLTSRFDKIVYDEIAMTDASGVLKIKNRELVMENLRMNLLDGSMTVNGSYSTRNPEKPVANLDLDISNWNIAQTFRTFNTARILAPIAESCSGSFSSRFNLVSTLDEDMKPVLSSLTGSGELQTERTIIENSETINRLAAALKNDKFKKLEFNDLDLSFQFQGGRVFVKPFKVKVGNSKALISGSNGFDQTLDYSMKMEIPTSEFGGNLNDFLGSASSFLRQAGLSMNAADLAKAISVELLIGGTTSHPTVKIGKLNLIGSSGKGLKDQLADEMRKEAERLIREAGLRAGTIREEARKAADRLRKGGYAQADKLESDASNPLARIAAQAAANKLRSETDKKADKIIKEADIKADQIVENARRKSESP